MAITAAIIAVLLTLGVASTHVLKMSDDNQIEEACERLMENELGLPEGTIDLTPETSAEKK